MLTGPKTTIMHARKLRRRLSLPEGLLWRELRNRPAGLKFRRQHPAGSYVLDFFCAEARLAIEIDGGSHEFGDRPARDSIRDRWLADQNVAVLHYAAKDVLDDVGAVISHIVVIASARKPLHQPTAGPPPRSGEEL